MQRKLIFLNTKLVDKNYLYNGTKLISYRIYINGLLPRVLILIDTFFSKTKISSSYIEYGYNDFIFMLIFNLPVRQVN